MKLTRWDQALSTDESNTVFLHLANWHLDQIISDKKQYCEIAELIARRDFAGLCHYELRYDTLTAFEATHLRQVLAFFQKRQDLELGIDKSAVAWRKFLEAEALCGQTNEIFRLNFRGGFYFPLDVESVLYRAQQKISSVLGDLPSLDQLRLRFGPGATTQVKKKDASVRRKLAQKFCCSEEAVRHMSDVLAEVPAWCDLNFEGPDTASVSVEISSGRISFARKSAKTDRTIAVEPMMNQMVQLGIGGYIADRLRREGIDITDQTRNQRMACEGSISGALATLDLSSASDTVSCGLVESLLPLDWWDFLRSFRTGNVSTPGGTVMKLQKFSSMGNGFTFPLETLIFFALACGCVDGRDLHRVSVYGDDIILPVDSVPLFEKVLTCCGFLLNASKSFSSGPFRESCGRDYLSGIDVRPCYMKGPLSGESCFVLHNFYVRNGLSEPASELLEVLDESLRLWGPDGYGDGHLLGDYFLTSHNRLKGWGGYTFETFTHRSRRAFYKLGADYVFPLYSTYLKEGPSGMEDLLAVPKVCDLWKRRSSVGSIRPERSDSEYVRYEGKMYLSDTLPGVSGYKRIKIYVLARP